MSLDRRTFVQLLAAAPLAKAALADESDGVPKYKIVSPHKMSGALGMPGPYPGRVVSVKAANCLDTSGDNFNNDVIREMMNRGMCELTRQKQPLEAWRRFFNASDVVGIKVNAGGYPWVVSSPPIVVECIRNLIEVGVKPTNIYIYERFENQLQDVNYKPHLPEGINIVAAERGNRNTDRINYDPNVYVEANFFGEEDTRSNLMKLVSQTVTKIINIPNVKDHGAVGATGCLKNIAYGSFSNVARTHQNGVSHTYSFVGTLAAVEPVKSKTVLQILDGLRGVWHGGPFAPTKKYVFYPKQILFGTDPVAIDRLLLDIVDNERKAHGAISIWNRDRNTLDSATRKNRDEDPNTNIIIREPGHVAYADKLGLGISDLKKIRLKELSI
ncbi:MAG: DUF362 domain-containing protein [Blastocatellia bacterium]|nr:DUF362 domain-containing protein [Blastocatellia bacterium]